MKKILVAALLTGPALAHPQVSMWTMPEAPSAGVEAQVLEGGQVAFVWDGSAAFEAAGSWSHRTYTSGAGQVKLNDINTHLGATYAVGATIVDGWPRPLVLRLDSEFEADSAVSPLTGNEAGAGELTAASEGALWGSRNHQVLVGNEYILVQRAFKLEGLQWGSPAQVDLSVYSLNTTIEHSDGSRAVGWTPSGAQVWMSAIETDSLNLSDIGYSGYVGSLEDVAPDLTV